MKPVFIILGETGSGKSTIYNAIINDEEFAKKVRLKPLVYATTRKPREGEVEGKDYYFKEKMEYIRDKAFRINDILEDRTYNKNDEGEVHYYTMKSHLEIEDEFDGMLCAGSVNQFLSYKRAGINVIPIIVRADVKTRINRCINREDVDDNKCIEICRRIWEESYEFSKINEELLHIDRYVQFFNDKGDMDSDIFKMNLYMTKNFIYETAGKREVGPDVLNPNIIVNETTGEGVQ